MEEILSFAYIPTHEKASPGSLKLYPGIAGFYTTLEISNLKEYYLKDSEVCKPNRYLEKKK